MTPAKRMIGLIEQVPDASLRKQMLAAAIEMLDYVTPPSAKLNYERVDFPIYPTSNAIAGMSKPAEELFTGGGFENYLPIPSKAEQDSIFYKKRA
jgi:hypothetical protein